MIQIRYFINIREELFCVVGACVNVCRACPFCPRVFSFLSLSLFSLFLLCILHSPFSFFFSLRKVFHFLFSIRFIGFDSVRSSRLFVVVVVSLLVSLSSSLLVSLSFSLSLSSLSYLPFEFSSGRYLSSSRFKSTCRIKPLLSPLPPPLRPLLMLGP